MRAEAGFGRKVITITYYTIQYELARSSVRAVKNFRMQF